MHLEPHRARRQPAYAIANGDPAARRDRRPGRTLGAADRRAAQPGDVHPPKKGLATPNIDLTAKRADSARHQQRLRARTTCPATTWTRRTSARRATPRRATPSQLEVTNVTGAHHPFHLHGFSIQPIDAERTAAETIRTGRSPSSATTSTSRAGFTLNFRVRIDPRAAARRRRPPAARSAAGSSTATSSSTPRTGCSRELVVTAAERQRAARRQRRQRRTVAVEPGRRPRR